MRLRTKLFVVAAAMVGLVLVSGSAQARKRKPRPAVTSGWAGYVVRAVAASFTEVAGSWVGPRVSVIVPGARSPSGWVLVELKT
jgi:hypothetical protein